MARDLATWPRIRGRCRPASSTSTLTRHRAGGGVALGAVRLAVLDGRPAPLIQDVMTLDDLRGAINEVMQQPTPRALPRGTSPGRRRRSPRATTRADRRPALRGGRGRAAPTTTMEPSRSTRARRRQPGRHRGRGRAGDGQAAAAHRGRRRAGRAAAADAHPTTSPRRPCRRPRPARRPTSTRRSAAWSSCPAVGGRRPHRRREHLSACSAPSETRTPRAQGPPVARQRAVLTIAGGGRRRTGWT